MPGPKKNAEGDISEAGDMLIYVAGYPMIYGRQPLYFKDPTFSARAKIPAPDQSDKIRESQAPEQPAQRARIKL
jgi:type IV secretion system protein VirD4